jgi:polyisoprenyl-phosphate glycosyltransferase
MWTNPLSATLAGLPDYDFTILFVDDGSSDDTAALLEQAAAADPRIGVIELSRNFGKEMALTAGLQALECAAAIIMDADLQHPPRYIPELLAKWQQGYEVVSTRRVKIDEQPFARRLGSRLFYALLNSISEFKMEPGTTDFRLLDRKVVDALKQFTERNRLFRGLIDWMGFKRTTIEFEAPARCSYSRVPLLCRAGLTMPPGGRYRSPGEQTFLPLDRQRRARIRERTYRF